MELPDNSLMLQLLGRIAENGVGFRQLFFRMNLPVSSIFDKEGEVRKKFIMRGTTKKTLEICFSDGEKLLGTFEVTPKMLNQMTADTCIPDEEEYSMHLVNVEKLLPVKGVRVISIELFFSAIKGLYGHTAGHALIDVGA